MTEYVNILQFTKKVKDAINRNSPEIRISVREANMVIYEINEILLKKTLNKDEILDIFNNILDKIYGDTPSIASKGFPKIKN